MSATLKALGWDLDADPTNASGPNPDWLTEESRDELADLLVKADGLIKERQNGTSHRVLRRAAPAHSRVFYQNSA